MSEQPPGAAPLSFSSSTRKVCINLRFTEHGAGTAVFLLSQFDSALYRMRLNAMTGKDMFNGNFYKHPGVFLCTLTMYVYFIGCDLLAFLAQDGENIHSGTGCQRHQQHFHWTWSFVLSAVMFSSIKQKMVTRASLSIKAHPFLQHCPDSHSIRHIISLLSVFSGKRKSRPPIGHGGSLRASDHRIQIKFADLGKGGKYPCRCLQRLCQ